MAGVCSTDDNMPGLQENAFIIKWRIENIKSWFQTADEVCFYSPQIIAETLFNTRWKLCLSTKRQLAEKYIILTLQRDVEDDGPQFPSINYELSFLSLDEIPENSKQYSQKFTQETVGQHLNKKVESVPENLTVLCKIWKSWSSVSKGGQCSICTILGKKSLTLEGAISYFGELDGNITLNFMSPSPEISFISFDVRKQSHLDFERVQVICKCFSSYSCELFFLSETGQWVNWFKHLNRKPLLTPCKPCTFQSDYSWSSFKAHAKFHNDTLKFELRITYYPGVYSERIEYSKKACKSTDMENIFNLEKELSIHFDCVNLSECKESYKDEIELSGDNESLNTAGKQHFLSSTLKKDLISLYNDRLFCDTMLRADNETFPCHRSVLSARSPVFKTTFTTELKETAGECINVLDISSDTMRRTLQFLYTDSCGDLEMQSAKDLYIASAKYDIASLKQHCSSFMKENLSPSNVCEILVLADMHQDKELEFAVNEYVLNYDEEVFGSNEWKLFMRNYSGLAAQVMYLKCIKK